MKRAKLEAVLRRKFRLRITTAKRGKFEVRVHPGDKVVYRCSRKREALVWLYTQLRCLDEVVFEIRKGAAHE